MIDKERYCIMYCIFITTVLYLTHCIISSLLPPPFFFFLLLSHRRLPFFFLSDDSSILRCVVVAIMPFYAVLLLPSCAVLLFLLLSCMARACGPSLCAAPTRNSRRRTDWRPISSIVLARSIELVRLTAYLQYEYDESTVPPRQP